MPFPWHGGEIEKEVLAFSNSDNPVKKFRGLGFFIKSPFHHKAPPQKTIPLRKSVIKRSETTILPNLGEEHGHPSNISPNRGDSSMLS